MPDLQNFYELHAPDAEQVKVQTLIEYVACDVIKSVREVLLKDQDNAVSAAALGYKEPPQLNWLKNWAAQLTFTLTVDEKSQLNPGIALNEVLPNAVTTFAGHPSVRTGQTFSLGLAAAYSSDATRKETLTLYIPLSSYTDDKGLAKARKWFNEWYKDHGPSWIARKFGCTDKCAR